MPRGRGQVSPDVGPRHWGWPGSPAILDSQALRDWNGWSAPTPTPGSLIVHLVAGAHPSRSSLPSPLLLHSWKTLLRSESEPDSLRLSLPALALSRAHRTPLLPGPGSVPQRWEDSETEFSLASASPWAQPCSRVCLLTLEIIPLSTPPLSGSPGSPSPEGEHLRSLLQPLLLSQGLYYRDICPWASHRASGSAGHTSHFHSFTQPTKSIPVRGPIKGMEQ